MNRHIVLSESNLIDMIKNENYLKNVGNPSQKVVKMSILKNPQNIEFLQNRTESDFFKAALYAPKVIAFLQPHEKQKFSNLRKIYRRALLSNPTVIKYIDEPTTEECFLAIEVAPLLGYKHVIKHITFPTQLMCYLAINIDPTDINYIKNPTEKMIFTALALDSTIIDILKEPYKTKFLYRSVKDKSVVIFDYTVDEQGNKIFDYLQKN